MFSDGPFDTKVGDTIVGLENGPCKERGSGLGGGAGQQCKQCNSVKQHWLPFHRASDQFLELTFRPTAISNGFQHNHL